MRARAVIASLVVLSTWVAPSVVRAWTRLHANTFATLPEGSGGPEGIEVAPDGTVFVGSLGFDADEEFGGEGRIFVFDRSGRFLREITVAGSTSHLLGLKWRAQTGTLLVVDFGGARVLEVDPEDGSARPYMTLPPLPPGTSAGLNDLTFDAGGNLYVSDSFQGVIWRVGPGGGTASEWVSDPLLTTTGIPPFGANGLRFNGDETALFVANTGNDAVVRIPITGGSPATTGTPGTPAVFVTGINGADGLLVDGDDNLWVVANQSDEIVVVDPTGRVIAKLGDFEGLRQGKPKGLLFPASMRFRGDRLLVTNLALNLELFGLPPAVDTAWTKDVTRYTIAVLPARIPKQGAIDGDHGGEDAGGPHPGKSGSQRRQERSP